MPKSQSSSEYSSVWSDHSTALAAALAIVDFEADVTREEWSSENSTFCQQVTGNLPVMRRHKAAVSPTPECIRGGEPVYDPLTEWGAIHIARGANHFERRRKNKTKEQHFINCKICNISLVSQCLLEVHLRGVKNKRNEHRANYSDSNITCRLCDIRFTEAHNLQEHYTSGRHRTQSNRLSRKIVVFRVNLIFKLRSTHKTNNKN